MHVRKWKDSIASIIFIIKLSKLYKWTFGLKIKIDLFLSQDFLNLKYFDNSAIRKIKKYIFNMICFTDVL